MTRIPGGGAVPAVADLRAMATDPQTADPLAENVGVIGPAVD